MNPTSKNPFGSDEVQAAYWQGSITRIEAQKVFDQFGSVIKELLIDVHGTTETAPPRDGLITLIAKLDMTLAFLADKLGVTPAEFNAYMQRKVDEFKAIQDAAATAAGVVAEPVEPSKVITLE